MNVFSRGRALRCGRLDQPAPRGRGGKRVHRGQEARRGAAMMIALVALLLAAAVSVSIVQLMLVTQKRLHQADRRQQAELLAASGIRRGAARLAEEPAYRGESWEIPAGELEAGPARVVIEVVPGQDGAPPVIRAEVLYPTAVPVENGAGENAVEESSAQPHDSVRATRERPYRRNDP